MKNTSTHSACAPGLAALMSGSDVAAQGRSCWVVLLASIVCLVVFVPVARSADSRAERWEPEIAISAGVVTNNLDGSATANFTDPVSDTSTEYRAPLYRLEGSVVSPGLFDWKWSPSQNFAVTSPRFLFRVGAGRAVRDEFDAVQGTVSVPSGGTVPLPQRRAQFCPILAGDPPIQSNTCFAATNAEVTVSGTWYTGMGFALPFRVMDQRMQFRTTVDYFGISIKSKGRVVSEASFLTGPTNLRRREVQAWSDRDVLHGMGASVAFDIDVAEFEKVDARLVFDTQLQWILSGNRQDFSGQNGELAAGFQTVMDPFIATATMGVRLVWKGAR